eukprot:Clim_evm42s153 gene=Clim_evmTU42s153
MSEISVTIQYAAKQKKFPVTFDPEVSVRDLKEKLAGESDIPADQQRLIYSGQILKDEKKVSEYGVKDGHSIHLLPTAMKKATPSSAQGSTAAPRPTPTPTSQSQSQSQNNANTNTNPLSGMGGMGGMGMPGMQEMMNNPEMMQQMMNSPIMQQMMDNPELMRAMIESNPMMQEMMNRNPEMRHVMSDPAFLRQTLQMMRNPSHMREVVRNNDRALQNVEAMPGGMNYLTSMYRNVQEPMMNAMDQDESNNNSTSDSNTNSQARSGPVPNPWAPNNTSNQSSTGGNTAASNPFAAFAGVNGTSTENSANESSTTGDSTTGGAGATGAMPGSVPGLASMLEDPMFRQSLEQITSNPEMMRGMSDMMRQNPYLASNPQLQEMMSDPERLQRMLNPENMRAMMQMQQAMAQLQSSGLFPGFGAGGEGAGAGGMSPEMMMNMMGGMGGLGGLGGAGATANQNDDRPPEERYASQLRQLEEMGFTNQHDNIRALNVTNGNVSAAIERLLGGDI